MSASEDHIGAALRDYALDQIAEIELQLARAGAWQHEGVHLARKAIARLRACLELLHASPQAARALERRLRSFAHGLSPLRDTQAALMTAKTLCDANEEGRAVWQEVVRELKQRRDRVLGAVLAGDPGFALHRARIGGLRHALSKIAWMRLLDTDLQRALEHARKRMRRARDPAYASTAPEPRHRLRRRSRRLLLQIELLRGIAHDATRPRAATTARAVLRGVYGKSLGRRRRQRLIDGLGWEQDLRVLRRALPPRATAAPMRRAVSTLRRELDAAIAATNKRLT